MREMGWFFTRLAKRELTATGCLCQPPAAWPPFALGQLSHHE
jgi:hypothetical protein